jgi:glycosyltransferase involved in cell wall biosynthesis
MRIALVTETYPPEVNGVAGTVARFVDGLRTLGHQVQVVRPQQSHERSARAEQRCLETWQLLCKSLPIPRYPQLRMGLPATRRLVRAWSDWQPDVVHIATEGPLGWSAQRAAERLNLPVSSDFRTNFHAYSDHYGIGWLRQPILGYLRRFHNSTQATLVPTEALRNELASKHFDNVQVVARGVDTQLFAPRRRSLELRGTWRAGPNTLVAIHVGRLAPEKNLGLVFAAFEAMRSRHNDMRLVVVGDGPERARLQAKFPSAIFTGVRTGQDLAAHYASGDVFLFPSATETFGNVTIEAMASGLAVVAYKYAAAAAHIEHGRSGLLAEYLNDKHFVALAVELVFEPLRIAPMGQLARLAAELVGWDKLVSQFESVLLSVAAREAYGKATSDPHCAGATRIVVDSARQVA